MTIKLRQSTASQEIPLGRFVDSADGDTEETGLTIANTDIKLWKMGATTLANKNSGGATHIANGIYYCVLDATDTNTLGGLVIFVHVAGALDVKVECEVLPANIYDSLVAGSANLAVALANVAHGGAAAVLTLERVVVEATTTDEPAVKLTGNGGGAGLQATGGAEGHGIHATANNTSGSGKAGLQVEAVGAGSGYGLRVNGNEGGAGAAIEGGADGNGMLVIGGTNAGHGIHAYAQGAGDGIDVAGGLTSGHGVAAYGGTNGDGMRLVGDGTGVNLNAGLNNLSAAQVNAEVDAALVDYDSPTRTEATADKDEVIAAMDTLSFDPTVDEVIVGSLTQAALAQFATDDTGEATAVEGSVAELSQGGAGGGDGATAAEVWAYGTRTLTQGAASVLAAVSGSNITVYRGTTWNISLTGLGNIAAYENIYFSVKTDENDSDDDAILRVDLSGLERIAGAAPDDVDNGIITVDDDTAGDITITVEEEETQNVSPAAGLYYDIKGVDTTGDVVMLAYGEGKFTIKGDITRAIV